MQNLNDLAATVQIHLTILNSTTATPQQIQVADGSLATLTKSLNPATSLQLSKHLLSHVFTASGSAPSIPSIHFAFRILEVHLLQSEQPWANFPDDIRAALRELSTTIISSLQPSHPPILKEKAVKLLSDIALREWPQRWDGFIDQLLADAAPSHIACAVLAELSDAIHEFSDRIQSARRQDLRRALAITLPQTLVYITKTIQQAHDSKNEHLFRIAMKCLCSFIKWADLHTLFNASVPAACISFLANVHVRDAALDGLNSLVSRHFQVLKSPLEEAVNNATSYSFRSLFSGLLRFIADSPSLLCFAPFALVPPLDAFHPLTIAFTKPSDLNAITAEDFSFCLRFFAMFAELGSTHFFSSYLFERKNKPIVLSEEEGMFASAYVDIMAVALSTPCNELQFTVLPFFTSVSSALMKNPNCATVARGRFISYFTTAFLQSSCAAIINLPNDGVRAHFTELIEEENLQVICSYVVNARMISTFTATAKISPDQAVSVSMERLMGLLHSLPLTPLASSVGSGPQAGSTAAGVLHPGARQRGLVVADGTPHGWKFGSFDATQVDAWRACVDAACTSVEGVAAGVMMGESGSTMDQMINLMRKVFVIVHPLKDASFETVKPHALRMLHPLYTRDGEARAACMETLLSLAAANGNSGGQGVFRSKVLSSLSSVLRRLCQAGVSEIGTFSKPLCDYAIEAIGSNNFKSMEKINLMESALASLMALPNLADQTDGVERVLNPLLSLVSSAPITQAIQTPQNLLSFLENGMAADVRKMCEAFFLIEAAMHQMVRPLAKSSVRIPIPGILSRSIAPKAVEISSLLITSLHGMCELTSVDSGRMEALRNMIHPTCREIAFLLNLDVVESAPRGIVPIAEAAVGDVSGVMVASAGEQRSSDALAAVCLAPPDKRYGLLRERLRDLRRGGYEMMRAGLYSGATLSETHLRALLTAVCSFRERIEPFHMQSVIARIVLPLLSFGVCGAGSEFLQRVGGTGFDGLLQVMGEHIVVAQRGAGSFSTTRVMEFARDHSRDLIARAVADMLAAMYPKAEVGGEAKVEVKQRMTFVPPVLRVEGLGMGIVQLWKSVCDVTVNGQLDYGSARVALNLAVTAADLAGPGDFAVFGGLLTSALRTAVLGSRKAGDETAGPAAIGAVTAVLKRWPEESRAVLVGTLGRGREDVTSWISECIAAFVDAGDAAVAKAKRHRVVVKTLVERVAEVEGLKMAVTQTVHALPEKMKTAGHSARSARRRRVEGSDGEPELTDVALDSLYGEGEPL